MVRISQLVKGGGAADAPEFGQPFFHGQSQITGAQSSLLGKTLSVMPWKWSGTE